MANSNYAFDKGGGQYVSQAKPLPVAAVGADGAGPATVANPVPVRLAGDGDLFSIRALTVPTTDGVQWSLQGADGFILELLALSYRMYLGTAEVGYVNLRRSSALSGGTSAALTPSKYDTAGAAWAGVSRTWASGVPTPTIVAGIGTELVLAVPPTTTGVAPSVGRFDLLANGRGPILRGASEFFSMDIDFNAYAGAILAVNAIVAQRVA